MSEENLQLRFDGPDLRAHSMDVTLIGPALFAFGELCQGANEVINRDKAKVRVLLKADIRANCVTVDLQLIQSVWETAKSLVANTNVATAKELLDWIGYGSAGTAGLLKFLQWKKDRKESSTEINQESGGNVITVKVEGDDNSVTVPIQVYNLSKSVKVVEAAKQVTAPVANSDELTIIHGINKSKITKQIAQDIQKAVPDQDLEPQVFTAHIVTHGPVLDLSSKHWRFKLNGHVENIDISQTNIAAEALARGGVSVGDTYKVRIEMTEKQTKTGYKTDYKVIEVLEFIPGTRGQQTTFDLPTDSSETQ